MKLSLIFLLTISFFQYIYSQEILQSIRGKVVDKQTGAPLPGAVIALTDGAGNPVKGVAADLNGNFKLDKVKLGRNELLIQLVGYKSALLSNLNLTSAKELFLQIELEEQIALLEEVVVSAQSGKTRVKNEMAFVSARTFTIEETEKYAGSLGDVARMASNYAGVTSLSDQQNEIVIRGNSPVGLLWRMNGIEIPNPNHFSDIGGTGGAISALNNNVLANSDFYTSAFPAQFGNALSGVFDLRMRDGNDQQHEFLGQMAFNGFELGAEGPVKIHKDSGQNASYIANYRYSTMAVLDKFIGLNELGLTAVPYYQDLSFKINIPTQKAGTFSVWGLGGLSSINPKEKVSEPDKWYLKHSGSDVQVGSDVGTAAVSNKYFFNQTASLTTSLYSSGSQIASKDDTFTIANPNPAPSARMYARDITYGFNTDLSLKLNAANSIMAGITLNHMSYDLIDSTFNGALGRFQTNAQLKNDFQQFKMYGQWRTNIQDQFEITTGLAYQYFSFTKKSALDPRAGIKWVLNQRQSVNIGVGLHSFLAPRFLFAQKTWMADGTSLYSNSNMGYLKSLHTVMGYDFMIQPKLRMKLETYYQYLYNIPVSKTSPASSLLNMFAGLDSPVEYDSLENKGKGENYGIELTLEKYLSKGYYFLISGSLFNSTYSGYDGKWRNSAFNSNFVINLLAGKEFKAGRKNTFNIDLKCAWGGSRRYVPYSARQISEYSYERVFNWDEAFTKRFADYFRVNTRVGYTINQPSYNLLLAFDFMNVTNRKNLFFNDFDPTTGESKPLYQFPFMPVGLIRVQF